MKLTINLEVSPNDEELDDDELTVFQNAVVDYIKDDVLQTFSNHDTSDGGFSFTVDEISVSLDDTDD